MAWGVFVEEQLGWGDSREWRPSYLLRVADVDEARERARALAHDHVPEHPAMPRERTVLRVGDNEWVVHIVGRTRSYHFRVQVGEIDE